MAHGVPISFAERNVGMQAALEHGRLVLRAATRRVLADAPGLDVRSRLPRVRPQELVSQALDADLLVLGLTRHRSHRLGPVASSALHAGHRAILFAPTVR